LKNKVLHVWDTAGIGSFLAKEQNKIGFNSSSITRNTNNPFGMSAYYKSKIITGKYNFVFRVLLRAWKYDLIHVHGVRKMVKHIRRICPKKKIVFEYHGTELRNFSYEERINDEKLTDCILVSTSDLLDEKCYHQQIYLPNPIDEKLFSLRDLPKNNKAFSFLKENVTKEDLANKLIEHGYKIKLETRENLKRNIPYNLMPQFLSSFEYYVDVPKINGKILNVHSLTGLQALSLGMKVIDHNFEIKTGLPHEHKIDNVIKKLNKIYQNLGIEN